MKVLETSTLFSELKDKRPLLNRLLRRPLQLATILGPMWAQNVVPPKNKRANSLKGIWRRLPDLNRGWRFCRQGR
jgi:hypothetical protein